MISGISLMAIVFRFEVAASNFFASFTSSDFTARVVTSKPNGDVNLLTWNSQLVAVKSYGAEGLVFGQIVQVHYLGEVKNGRLLATLTGNNLESSPK